MSDSVEVRTFSVTENPWTKTIHTMRYKLVHYVGATTDGQDLGELYDLEKDPWEMRNLYFDPEFGAVIHSLRRQLLDWIVETTRVVTVQPDLARVPPPWDDDRPLSDEDGRIGKATILKAMARNPNYT